MTPYAVTIFYVLTTLNNAGQLAPVDKTELPAGVTTPIAFSEGQCFMVRGKMSHPEKYVCQLFTSAPTTKWTYLPPGAERATEAPPEPVPQTALPEPDTAPKPVPQVLPEHPASIAPTGIETKPSDIQVGGKQYTKGAGLTWVERESTKPDSFADVSVGPNDLQSKDQPSPLPQTARAEAPKKRVVVAQGPHYYDRATQPLQAFIDTVMLPFDFLAYPARRGW